MKNGLILGCLVFLLEGCITYPTYKAVIPQYKQEFATAASISELTVNIIPTPYPMWTFQITNNSEKMIKLLLDESSYVTTSGVAQRLVRGKTKVLHSDTTQPNMPIPPKAKFQDVLVLESYVPNVSLSSSPYAFMFFKVENINAKGKFYLVFEINEEKKTWITEITFTQLPDLVLTNKP